MKLWPQVNFAIGKWISCRSNFRYDSPANTPLLNGTLSLSWWNIPYCKVRSTECSVIFNYARNNLCDSVKDDVDFAEIKYIFLFSFSYKYITIYLSIYLWINAFINPFINECIYISIHLSLSLLE